ncbi:MAG: hypothetical protein UW27_C0002G0025 [Parcubacteria group bacterium GW2011_GWA1_44_13]|uniref:Uncharacterized protein n=1 Tax=Candidatus Nomurabacteria bacterium GW2011_GWB1_44_12 TaxID=1618748 RepID=A0A837IDT5_9BACT|nr:MAG: hypothetical protein UW25_C0002G0025 [Candidatus Nomurabacteria bacterium GW2011_GWB1_44_12]KKT38375.1 MAG: hypothetical protein UW27_C0002G0025 [Parcubacteria group bacterium GW2011_GWA1_44_13]
MNLLIIMNLFGKIGSSKVIHKTFNYDERLFKKNFGVGCNWNE